MPSSTLCEACQLSPVQVTLDNEQPGQPYRLCLPCEQRLEARSLRPLEWFNLAAIHGPCKFWLHDDFYYDNGIADQPIGRVKDRKKYPAPTLEQVKDNQERLIDYAMTLNRWDTKLVPYFSVYDNVSILESLKQRCAASPNADIKSRSYQICAHVLKGTAQDWIREQWSEKSALSNTLAEATAACLPFDEGFALVTSALELLPPQEASHRCFALAPFHTAETLDWMEDHATIFQNYSCGQLVAQSHFSWTRAEQWLQRGRPLSLRALEAILLCCHSDTKPNRLPRYQLESPAPIDVMVKVLDEYYERDRVPNVRKKVEAIKEFWQI